MSFHAQYASLMREVNAILESIVRIKQQLLRLKIILKLDISTISERNINYDMISKILNVVDPDRDRNFKQRFFIDREFHSCRNQYVLSPLAACISANISTENSSGPI